MVRLDNRLWPAISPLLDRALDLGPDEGRQLVEALRSESPEVASVLEDLLAEHDRVLASGFLETPPDLGEATPAGLVEQTIGAYTLERPLGMGGMGTVWLARRSDGRFEGHVAVKLVNLAVLNRSSEDRFKREGTILARLTHPGIARLLDAGVTATGQPFLVLEFVEGTRVDRYADAHRLGVRARLDLFMQIAEGVAHAHAHLIVHRDLKPSNILVDAAGQVKLLDFGIAKLIEDDAAGEGSALTLPAGRALTPEYAAPEQVRGEKVTTATDVYALGVLLYRLLVGGHPTAEASATPAEHLRALTENDPIRLSDAVAALSADPPAATRVAAERSTSPDRLRRVCRGDLDNVLAKALRKQPTERYTTVTAFADDVQRYLRDEPVRARPDAWRYRAGKFLRRHKAGAAAAALIATTLIVATIVTGRQMIEARRQRDDAHFQARRAQASSEFMRYLVTQIGTTPMTMREVLDRGRVALEQQYSGDPLFVARMLMLMSGPYIELGDYDTSAEMMQRALEIATRIDDPDLLAATHCSTGYDLVEKREFAQARMHLTEGHRHAARLNPPPAGLLVECEIGDTSLAMAEGRAEDAVGHAEKAVALLEAAGNTTTTRYTSALSNLGTAYAMAERRPEAVRTHRKVVEVSERIGRGRTIGVVVALSNEAVTEWPLGWWGQAERALVKAFDIAHGLDSSGAPPPYLALSNGRVLASLGRLDEAEASLTRLRDDPKAAARWTWAARLELVDVWLARSDLSHAAADLPSVEEHLGQEIPTTSAARVRLQRIRLIYGQGDAAEARRRLQQALDQEGYPGRISPSVHMLLEFGARLALEAHDDGEAERLARSAIVACERYAGTEEPSAFAGRARLTLGLVLADMGRAGEARAELQRAETEIGQAAGASHPWVQEARTQMATLSAGR